MAKMPSYTRFTSIRLLVWYLTAELVIADAGWQSRLVSKSADRLTHAEMPTTKATIRAGYNSAHTRTEQMMSGGQSKIEWTERTWNPTVGCTKLSQGCKNCYAEGMSRRLQAMGTPGYENGFKLTLLENRLDEPLLRSKPTIYFVNSMSDLFHQSVPDSYITQVFETIRACPQHTFQILTKRAERLASYCGRHDIPLNAWLGVSVEDKRYGVPRIDHLRNVQASIRFLSVEPLLEDLGRLNLRNIDWVIVGGESGPKARPMKTAWVERVKQQCEAQGALFFFKQWGGWGADGVRRSKKANGRLLAGQTWDAMPDPAALI